MDITLSRLLEWDHKSETDWQTINDLLSDLQNNGHKAYLYEVPDTGGDSIGVIVTNLKIPSQEGIQVLYNLLTKEDDEEQPYYTSELIGDISQICADIDDRLGITIINPDTEDKIESMPIGMMESIISNRNNTLLVVNIIFSYLDSLE